MRIRLDSVLALILSFAGFLKADPVDRARSGNARSPEAAVGPALAAVRLNSDYGHLPLQFEPNRGQASRGVQFLSRGSGYALSLSGGTAVLSLARPGHAGGPAAMITMKPAGAAGGSQAEGVDPLPGKTNYLIGSDPRRWRRDIPTYRKVRYRDVWPGIDLVYYGNQRQLEYDFIVRPGADPNRIRLLFDGQERLRVDDHGDLVMITRAGELRHRKPVVYQETGGVRKEIGGSYVLKGRSEAAFQVARYDPAKALIIDPALVYSTFIGGSGTDYGFGIAADTAGNTFIAGLTYSPDFPAGGGVQGSARGGSDILVAKLNAGGTALVYSTYVGGGSDDAASGIAVDPAGNVYVTGYTSSADFPSANAAQAARAGGIDAIAFKLNSAGNAFVYSTCLGGTTDDYGNAIAADAAGNAYVAGYTFSSNFPVTFGAYQTVISRSYDAFVVKLNAAGAKVYATYLGGIDQDAAFAIAIDGAGSAYVAGFTSSYNFPVNSSAFQNVYRGSGDAFVSKLSPAGDSLVYSTFLGGSGYDQAYAIRVDGQGNAYIAGYTFSTDFPVSSSAPQASMAGLADAFVAKVNASGSALLWATYLGGNRIDQARGIDVDSAGNAYVAGYTYSSNFRTANALQDTKSGSSDALHRSADGGASWTAVPGYPANSVSFLRALGTNVYAVDCRDIYVSADGGWGWSARASISGDCIRDFAVDPGNQANMYAATATGLVKTTNGASTWTGGGLSSSLYFLEIDANNPQVLYAGGTSGLYRTTNRAASWSSANPASASAVRALGADPAHSGVVYAAVDAGTYRSADFGATWTKVSTAVPSYFAIPANGSSSVYMAGCTSVYSSADAGITWTYKSEVPSIYCLTGIETDPANASILYAAGGDGGYRSTDGGATWTRFTGNQFSISGLARFAFSQSSPVAMFALAAASPAAFVAKIDAAGGSFLYSTYLAGGQTAYAFAISSDGSGNAYVAGAAAGDFPTTPGALQTSAQSYDAFVAKITDATPPCTLVVKGAAQPYSAAGAAAGSVSVIAPSGCGWSASAAASWINLFRTSGTGTGAVYFSLPLNTGPSRKAAVTIGSQSVMVSQWGVCGLTQMSKGQTVSGSLASTDCSSFQRGIDYYADTYVFAGNNGDRIAVIVNSTDFEPAFYLTGPGNTSLSAEGGPSPRVPAGSGYFTLPASGTYGITVTSRSPFVTGSYSLSLFTASATTYTVFGRVTASGAGMSGVNVNLSGSVSGYTTTDSTGNYAFGVAAGGNYTITPARSGVTFVPASQAFTSLSSNQVANFSTPGGSAPGALQFYPVAPCRVADTRASEGKTGAFGPPFMGAGSTRTFPIPQSACNVPSTAAAYSLNVTVVPRGPLSYLSIWPAGQPQPLVSTLNSFGGSVVANAAIVPAGTNGAINIYVSDSTDVLFDINGYFAPPAPGGLQFFPVSPCRVADTRASEGKTGAFGPPVMAGNTTRTFPIPSGSCAIPSTAAAYSLNMTVVPSGPLSYLTTWPAGQPQPLVSTLNSFQGAVVANAAIVPAGTNGSINVYASDTTEVLFDINGYFAPPASGGLNFYPATPCRVADTRATEGKTGAFGPPALTAAGTRSVPIPSGSCNIPSTAAAYSLNFTVVPPGPLSYLSTWPTGQPQPLVSTLNAFSGAVVANAAIVPAGTSGAISIYASDATNVLFDINGYFAP